LSGGTAPKAGADSTLGGNLADDLSGLAGDDTLLGGACSDTLDGGLGDDVLHFGNVAEANGDVIADFSAAQGDLIDLRAIDANGVLAGNQAFAWIGVAAFTNAASQLRFSSGMLQGDVDGNGVADFQIGLTGVASLTAASIFL